MVRLLASSNLLQRNLNPEPSESAFHVLST